MSDHLSSAILNALADGELSSDQLAGVNEHLAECPNCTSCALVQSLLNSATARDGQRYTPPVDFRERLAHLVSQEGARLQASPSAQPARRSPTLRWAVAIALLLVCASLIFVDRNARLISAENAGLVTEVCDQHIATLAANSPPQVISSDRHTVKPWFQGKIPFSFNLPQDLPPDTTLDGANLTYLHNQPTAQLLYSIARHHVSVFLRQSNSGVTSNHLVADHSGFHVTEFRTNDLSVVAVSDVDPSRLSDLVARIGQAQAPSK